MSQETRTQFRHRLYYHTELITKYLSLETKRMGYQRVLDFHHEILQQLYFLGWKLFQGSKYLKETDVDHAHTTQSTALWEAKSIGSSLPYNALASACGQPNNRVKQSLTKLEESPGVWELTQPCDT